MSTQQQRDRCSVPPALLRRKRGREEGGRGCPSPLTRVSQIQLRPGRPPQVNPGWIWSKSTSDIPIGTRGYEEEENRPRHPQHGTRSKESVEKWQEDLTKWKNRRRSTNSDLHRKFQEREPVVKTTSSGTVTVTGQNKTPHGHSKRDQLSPSKPGPTPTSSTSSASSSPPSSKASHPALRPHSRAPLHRGYTVETLLRDPGPPAPASCSPAHDQPRITPVAASCSPAQNQSGAMPTSHPTLLEEELPAASLPSDSSSSSATTPSACSPYTSQTHIKLRSGPATLPPAATAGLTQPEGRARRSTMGPYPYQSAGSADHHTPPSRPVADRKVTSLHHGLFPGGGRDAGSQKNHRSLTPGDPGTWEEAGGLGKGPAHHSSLYRYNSTSWSSSASLPRGYRRSEGSARLTTVLTARPFGTQPSRGSSLPRLATYRDSISSTHPLQGGDRKTPPLSGDECRSLQPTLSRQVATSNITPPSRHAQNRHSGREQEVAKEQEEEVEGQRQNGLPDRSDPPRSSEAVASDTHLPPPANHGAPPRRMRVSLSLKPNSVDDFGFQTDWTAAGARVTSVQRGSPAEVCQLCVGDVITAVGGARVEQMISGQWESTMSSALHAGSLAMDVNRYSNQGGSGTGVDGTRKTLNLCADVPMLIGCPDRHAPNHDIVATPTAPLLPAQGANVQIRNGECEGTRKTALSKELEGILLRNQQRRAEFFSVKGGTESAISDLQVPSLNPSASSWSWDHEEERKRQVRWQEEQERHLQERYQRDQQRLQAEWQRAQEGEEPRESKGRSGWKGNPGVGRSPSPTRPAASRPAQHWATETRSLRVQNTDPGPARPQSADPAPVRPQSADPAPVRPQGAETGSGKEVQPPAKPDLVKSKSTPTLASLPKGLGEPRKPSKAEKDRQQILEEMKKRTQLLTDNSWIRQRTPIALKEPLFTGSLRRYESLDSLHPSSASDPFSSDLAGVCRPLSATGFSGPGRSISPRYTTCSALPDQLTTPITSSSQLFLPESTGLSRQAGSACAVASILEEESDQKSEFALETTSLSVNVAASNSSFPAADLVM